MNCQQPYSLYLFGSRGRAELNTSSDTDVLVLVHPGHAFDRESVVLPNSLKRAEGDMDLTFYSEGRIREMHAAGHLFIWHLYLEAKFLDGCCDILRELGQPNDYTAFEEDVSPLIELLESSTVEIDKHPGNIVYEAGLAYVCARNVSMSASYYSEQGLTFSPYAPFLRDWGPKSFPLSKQQYDELRLARLSTTRGGMPPVIQQHALKEDIDQVRDWSTSVVERARQIYL